jgi:hypothetical protein
MTDRISGSKNNPYGVQSTPEKPTADGRVPVRRTHAQRHSRVDSGAVDLKNVEKKRSELEKVHKIVTDLTTSDSDPTRIAGKFKNLCKNFNIADLSQQFDSKLQGLTAQERARIEEKLGWTLLQLKNTDTDAVDLVRSINKTLAKLPKT